MKNLKIISWLESIKREKNIKIKLQEVSQYTCHQGTVSLHPIDNSENNYL